ncbi:MAG: glycosyltransferase family 4 protein [Bacteroidota bacterium]
MRILITTYQGGLAGSTQSIYYLAKGLAEKGHDVFLGCRTERWIALLAANSGIQIVPMRMKGKYSLEAIKEHRDVIRKYNIELVNAQSSIDRYLPIFSKWLYGGNFRIVHTRRQRPASVGGFLQNFIYHKGTDRIVAVSRGVKNSLVGLGLKEQHIEVIHNGLDAKKMEVIDAANVPLLRAKHQIPDHHKIIGCISRFKEQQQIVDALEYVTVPCTLILVGVEEEQVEVNLSNTIHRVLCTGLIDNEAALQYYPLFDVKVLASSMEGLSQSLLEAMSMGILVIATNASGNPDLIQHNENGFLFEGGNIKQLGEQMQQVLTDKHLHNRLANAGKATVDTHFSIQRTVEQYEQLFLKLIGGTGI